MSTLNVSKFLDASLTANYYLFPELTYKQYRACMVWSIGVSMKVLAAQDGVTVYSCDCLLKRSSEKLNIKQSDLRGVVMLRLFLA